MIEFLTPQAEADHNHTDKLPPSSRPELDPISSYTYEYQMLVTSVEEMPLCVVPLKSVRIPGYIRKASGTEEHAGAWILQLGKLDSSE